MARPKQMPKVIFTKAGRRYRPIEIRRDACEGLRVIINVYGGQMAFQCIHDPKKNAIWQRPCMTAKDWQISKQSFYCPLIREIKKSKKQTTLTGEIN